MVKVFKTSREERGDGPVLERRIESARLRDKATCGRCLDSMLMSKVLSESQHSRLRGKLNFAIWCRDSRRQDIGHLLGFHDELAICLTVGNLMGMVRSWQPDPDALLKLSRASAAYAMGRLWAEDIHRAPQALRDILQVLAKEGFDDHTVRNIMFELSDTILKSEDVRLRQEFLDWR